MTAVGTILLFAYLTSSSVPTLYSTPHRMRLLSWGVFAIAAGCVVVAGWYAVRARRIGKPLGPAFLPALLVMFSLMASSVNLGLGYSPAWVAASVMVFQGSMLATAVWLLLKSRATLRSLVRRQSNKP